MQKHTQEKAPNEIFMTERQTGEKEARSINIPASKLRGSCLRSSNVSNDTDKSFTNNLNADAVSDDAKQQTVVLSTENNSDIISRALISPPDESNGQLNVTGVSLTSSSTKKQNLYRSRENLSLIDSEEVDDNMENEFSNTQQPSDEELKDFLEYIEKGQSPEENIEYEQDILRKRTAAELGKSILEI